jgi:hypothetical protein
LFFNELDKVIGKDNPQKELRHLKQDVFANVDAVERLTTRVNELKGHIVDKDMQIQRLRADIKAITDSKSWRMMRAAGKTLEKVRLRSRT